LNSINGYTMTSELSSKNAGFCRWGFCKKNSKAYFIKEFLEPVYPTDKNGLSQKTIARKQRICAEFFSRKKAFYDTLSKCRTGNVVVVEDFFRFGTKYYITTEKIETANIDPKVIKELDTHKKETLIRSILYSVSAFHHMSIVHADLKPDNIVFKKLNSGFYTAKIIDFDAGFLVGEQLDPDDLHGDFLYLSPEAYLFSTGESVNIDTKIDIFALGILFHQIWTGKPPNIPNGYRYIFEAILDNQKIVLSKSIPDYLRDIITKMLAKDSSERPSAEDILDYYRQRDEKEGPPSIAENTSESEATNNASAVDTESTLKTSKNLTVPTDFD